MCGGITVVNQLAGGTRPVSGERQACVQGEEASGEWGVASDEWGVASDDPSAECASVLSNQLDHHAPSDHGCRALQAGKRDVAFRTK